MIWSIESVAPKMILSLLPAAIQTPKSLNGGDLLSARKSDVTISIGKSRKWSSRGLNCCRYNIPYRFGTTLLFSNNIIFTSLNTETLSCRHEGGHNNAEI